jgi:integrase
MAIIRLKGLKKVKAKGRVYWYAWRGGPRLTGEPGTPEFNASYQRAVNELRALDESKFRSVIVGYKASGHYVRLAESTRREWASWLDRITDAFGGLSTAQFDRPEKIRPIIRQWRNKWQDKPRTADYGMQVLSRVLSYAVEIGKIAGNPCEGISRLYSSDRSSIIWTDTDIAPLKATCSAQIAHAVDLASHTGLRLGDLLRVSWSHVKDDRIELATGKSRQRKLAIVPLYDALSTVLSRIPKRATTILTNSRGRPWTTGGFARSFADAKLEAGIADRNLHFHDLRGTAATKFYLAGMDKREIAEIMGWEESHVEQILRRYVDRSAATKDLIRRLNEKNRQG